MKWQDQDLVVVTGGGSGLGRSLVRSLAATGARVLTVGRRSAPLEETAATHPERVQTLTADVSDPRDRQRIVEAASAYTVCAVVHNAGVLEPVGPLRDVDLETWRTSMGVNVEGPVFLTQGLLPHMGSASRVLHISSGAAHKAYQGWGAYCTTKAALHMVYQVYREELWQHGVLVGSLRPGVIDTPMQAHIREQTADRFPAVDRFVRLKDNGQLYSPEEAADFIQWALLETGDKQFTEQEWNISDEEHHQRWRDTRQV